MIIPFTLKAQGELQVVPSIDIDRYLGTWYEIVRYPNSFQKKCERSWVEYTLRDDGNIGVLNRCIKFDGEMSKIKVLDFRALLQWR